MPRHPPNALTTLNRSHCQCSSSRYRPRRKRQQTGLPFTTQSIQQCHRRVRPEHFIGATPSSSLVSGLKTSFSRLDPIPRGQATVIRSLIRRSPKATNNKRSRATSFLPPSNPSTTSGRLGHPWIHRNWARTSWAKTQNTWKPPDQSSLHNVCRTGIRPKPMQTFIFFKRQCRQPSVSTPIDLVELSGIEPLTPCLQSRCSPS